MAFRISNICHSSDSVSDQSHARILIPRFLKRVQIVFAKIRVHNLLFTSFFFQLLYQNSVKLGSSQNAYSTPQTWVGLCLGKFSKCLQHTPDMSGTLPGEVLKMPTAHPRHEWDFAWGSSQSTYSTPQTWVGLCLGKFSKCLKHTSDMSGTLPGYVAKLGPRFLCSYIEQ